MLSDSEPDVVTPNAEYVSDPGDDEAGGVIDVTFEVCQRLDSVQVLDIDHDGSYLVAMDVDGFVLGIFPLENRGDNSVQVVDTGGLELVRRVQLVLQGGGALAGMIHCPTPGADIQ